MTRPAQSILQGPRRGLPLRRRHTARFQALSLLTPTLRSIAAPKWLYRPYRRFYAVYWKENNLALTHRPRKPIQIFNKLQLLVDLRAHCPLPFALPAIKPHSLPSRLNRRSIFAPGASILPRPNAGIANLAPGQPYRRAEIGLAVDTARHRRSLNLKPDIHKRRCAGLIFFCVCREGRENFPGFSRLSWYVTNQSLDAFTGGLLPKTH